MKKTEESLYIRSLLWIYKKGSSGFSKEEMRQSLEIKDNEEWAWISWVVFNGLNGDAPIAYNISTQYSGVGKFDDTKFYITALGVSTVIDYLDLREARKSSIEARHWAIIALIVSVAVGIVQIFGVQDVNVHNFPETQSIKFNDVIKAEVTNFPKLQDVWVNNQIK